MLERLRIRNFILVKDATLEFGPSLNIIAGETGAGKSILLDAISLLLGGRAQTDWIQKGEEEAILEGSYRVENRIDLIEKLHSFGLSFDPEDSTIFIKRILSRSGKHRIWIQGELCPLQTLQKMMEGCIDLCSQHEHQTLLQTKTQLSLLDKDSQILNQYQSAYEPYALALQEIEGASARSPAVEREIDFWRYQIQEIETLDPEPDEDQKLILQKNEYLSGAQNLKAIEKASLAANCEETGALAALRRLLGEIRKLETTDLGHFAESLQYAVTLTEEISFKLEKELQKTLEIAQLLDPIQDRLSSISELKRKYGPTLNEVFLFLDSLRNKIQLFEEGTNRLEILNKLLPELEEKLEIAGEQIHAQRISIAELISKKVTQNLKDLSMQDAEFRIEVEIREAVNTWSNSGPDDIRFLICTNRGGSFEPVAKVASGGELSRLMLALREASFSASPGVSNPGVYLFDEIDAGMSGQTAFVVGQKLARVSQRSQVICITHLPQVAAFADRIFQVSKQSKDTKSSPNTTETQIRLLVGNDRLDEISRMLGSIKISDTARKNARELIEQAKAAVSPKSASKNRTANTSNPS